MIDYLIPPPLETRMAPTIAAHAEPHRTSRIGGLRAAVLGADDGIISIASLMVGVAAAAATSREVVIAGVAGTVAGALSMAAGEYVSVSSQSDTEHAELARERVELDRDPERELRELAGIYRDRGLGPELAMQVAKELSAHDALKAHARDELGLSDALSARPLQAAVVSALSFTAGAALPLLVAATTAAMYAPLAITGASLVCLAALGALSATIGGARVLTASARVTFWGAFAMLVTYLAGRLFGGVI